MTGAENASKYLFEGTVTASGRVETLSPTVVVRDVQGQTFEGAGVFEGVGTLNGTGLFAGQGDFSGPMVQPGSFYKTGLLPGVYNMFAVLPNGRQVLLPDPVTVGVEASYDVEMTMPGAVFADVLEDMEGNVLPGHDHRVGGHRPWTGRSRDHRHRRKRQLQPRSDSIW